MKKCLPKRFHLLSLCLLVVSSQSCDQSTGERVVSRFDTNAYVKSIREATKQILECYPGFYYTNGANHLFCKNGQWEEGATTSEKCVECPASPDRDHATKSVTYSVDYNIAGKNRGKFPEVTYTCRQHYEAYGTFPAWKRSENTWIEQCETLSTGWGYRDDTVQCKLQCSELPKNVADARTAVDTTSNVLTSTCNSGYSLNGQKTGRANCRSGEWVPDLATLACTADTKTSTTDAKTPTTDSKTPTTDTKTPTTDSKTPTTNTKTPTTNTKTPTRRPSQITSSGSTSGNQTTGARVTIPDEYWWVYPCVGITYWLFSQILFGPIRFQPYTERELHLMRQRKIDKERKKLEEKFRRNVHLGSTHSPATPTANSATPQLTPANNTTTARQRPKQHRWH